MAVYRKESLETLRQRIDLVEVIGGYVDLKRSGAAFKGLCPFHDEKSPSFMIQKGDKHYHCFGCGAHGDAIQFLMSHVQMRFSEAVEHLAQRFQVPLEQVESEEIPKGPNKKVLIETLEHAAAFYHFYLLHTPEGHEALQYLYQRGVDLEFIKLFGLGLAPKEPGLFRKVMQEKQIGESLLLDTGLITQGQNGQYRELFAGRITIPIQNPMGGIIGFSARKYREETFGGKYVNTPETALFKKSHILFGLNYSRRRIAKERKAIIVEGQIDALRLIKEGLNLTVAGQGTAFGESQVKELLHLGVNQIYLALDSDNAGQEAIVKIGNFFQKAGVEVGVVQMPQGSDPDSYIRERGVDAFVGLLEASCDYLTFLYNHYSKQINTHSPAGKQQLVLQIAMQIRSWEQTVMVHESLRKLARLAAVPEEMMGIGQHHTPNLYIKRSDTAGAYVVDPNRVLEADFLRWLLHLGEQDKRFVEIAKQNIRVEDFQDHACRCFYQAYLQAHENQQPKDLLALAIQLADEEGQQLLSDLTSKRINKQRGDLYFTESLQRLLERNWMEQREAIKRQIQSGRCSDEEVLRLVKIFDEIKAASPTIKV